MNRDPNRGSHLHGGAFCIDGIPTFLYGGEVHYFRLEPAVWAERIAQAKALGLNAIASYIPWIWHEPTPGAFDFTGASHPARNLARFLALVAEAGLHFVARIGPVSNAELVGEGVPPWLFERDPDLQLQRDDGSAFVGVPSYRHPGFLAAVSKWYDALRPVIAPHLASNGGNIVLVQLCNEIDMQTWLARQPDRHTHVEQAYASYVGRPDATQPVDGTTPLWPDAVKLEWMGFYADYFASYVEDLAERAAIFEVPLMVNVAQWTDHHDRGRGINAPMTTMLFREMAKRVPNLVVGGDYYPRRLDYENFHDITIATEVVRMVSTPNYPVVCPELMSGSNEDRPRIYASDISLLLHTAAGYGLNGLNLYMLAGGENPPGIGLFGKEHDWQAPIAPDGSLRPSSEAIKAFGAFLASAPDFASSHKVVDTHIGFYAPYFQSEYLRGPAIEALERRREAIFQDGLLRTLALANISFDLIDLERAPLPKDSLWVFCEDWMDAPTQARLAQFVIDGGRLMLFPTVPTRGLDGQACTTLADALGLQPSEVRTGSVHVAQTSLPILGTVQCFGLAANDEVLATTDEVLATTDDGAPCAMWRKVGQGAALVAGFGLRHRFDRQVALTRQWAGLLGVTPALKLEPSDAIGVVRVGPFDAYITLLNYHDEALALTGSVLLNGKLVPLALTPLLLPRRSAVTLKMALP
jgi:beta-galactosidase